MDEEAITSGRQKALREAMILLDLAITRSRGNLLNTGLEGPSSLRSVRMPAPGGCGMKVFQGGAGRP
jgi:hypothetical protein